MASDSSENKICGYSSVDEFVGNGLKSLMEAVKVSSSLPTERWKFFQTHDSFNKIMNNESEKLLTLMNKILKSQNMTTNIRTQDQQQKLETIIEANDNILEGVAADLDKMNGLSKGEESSVEIQSVSAQLPVNGSWNRLESATFTVTSSVDKEPTEISNPLNSIRLLTAKNVIRPQVNFKDKIDNSNKPWVPRITEKPNSLKPLALLPEESDYGEFYPHPYEYELERFVPPPEQLHKENPVVPKALADTPLIEVTTPEQLSDLLKDLREQKQFAIDLEHHSYRTFMGITCLMQISTQDSDYLIDTFSLRHKLCILNEVFTKPSIVKVFHGADSDIEWLQRDLSLYVVNMFDTYQAAKQLQFPKLSLAYLMQRYCQVTPNKYFQLADWRIRPLPEELKTYARMDTHYLLYIYQMLKNELLLLGNGNDNILKAIIHQSTQVCSKVYLKPLLNDESHLHLYHKSKRMFDNKQMYAFRKLYQWRDTISRNEDESTGYVLPNHMLLHISESLPREMQGILACCNPIPPLVQTYLLELHHIILQAREQSVVKPILKEDNRSRGSTLQFTKVNMDSPLHCVHDLSNCELRDDLPTLLGSKLNAESDLEAKSTVTSSSETVKIEKFKSMYSVFNTPETSDEEDQNEGRLIVSGVKFLAPYERYKLVRPFIQAQEKADEEKRQTQAEQQKTDEDRIANLHAHFVKVAQETPQIMPEEVPGKSEDLVSFKPSRKRPRSNERNSDPTNRGESLASRGGSKKMPRMQTPKRNQNKNNDDRDTFVTPQQPKRNRNKKSKKRQNLWTSPSQGNANNQQLHNNERFGNAQQLPGSYPANTRGFEGQRSFPNQNYNGQNDRQGSPNKKQKFNARKGRGGNNFKPFDYSAVDFQQFQGGAGGSNSNRNNFKSQFKAKNKHKKFNSNFNKSTTYRRNQ